MRIECAILGLLARGPLAGYDLKKRMQDDPAMPWSGNNNQIYKALSAMQGDGLIRSELIVQDPLPSRKEYTLTEAGHRQLRAWLLEPPEMLELKKPFLAQLALADALGADEVDALLASYEVQLRAQADRSRPPEAVPEHDYGAALRAMVAANLHQSYRHELAWAESARKMIAPFAQRAEALAGQERQEGKSVAYQVQQGGGAPYLYYPPQPVRPEAMDPTQFVGDCMGEGLNRLLIDASALPEAFFRLSTGLAGEVMQKLAQYHIRAALVIRESDIKGKFADMLIEANRGDVFRAFEDRDKAAVWLEKE